MELAINNLKGLFNGYSYKNKTLSIGIEKGKIVSLNNNPIDAEKIIDGKNYIASIPFNDAHTHIIFGGERFFELGYKLQGMSYSDILARGGGIKHTVQQTRNTSTEELTKIVKKRLDAMLSHGTLVVEAKTGYGLSIDEEIRLLNILNNIDHEVNVIPTFGGAHVPPPNYPRRKYIEDIIDEMLPYIAKNNLAKSTDVFCDRGAFTVNETREIFQRSEELGIPVRVHAEELEYTGVGKLMATEFNLLSADHLLLAKKEDFQILANNNTVATFMPLAPIGLFTNNQPSGWRNSNVIIGLGSDFNPNNWIISMQTAIRTAVFRYKMTPEEAMKAATTGSYKSIYANDGPKLDIGSNADLILLHAKSLDEFCAKIGQNLLRYVIKDGKIIHENNHTII